MAVYYSYSNAIFGTQSTVGGSAFNYNFAPASGSSWSWTGSTTTFLVEEQDGASNYNGDPTNETVSAQEQIGGTWEQTTQIGGVATQTIYDFTFTVTAPDATVYRVAVIDVDLNNDDDLSDAGEDGYYLVFPDGVPPAGVTYTVGSISNNDDSIPHATLGATVVCFAAGTMIDTDLGACLVEDLQVGDLVKCAADAFETEFSKLRWVGRRMLSRRELLDNPKLRPVRIVAGALGDGLPQRDLLVSRQHRMLLQSKIAKRMFGQDEVLISAIKLTTLPGIYVDDRVESVGYFHLLFDEHKIIFAENAATESLFTGPEALKAVGPEVKKEILALFPELGDHKYAPKPARYIPSGREQKQFVARQQEHNR
ncbi:MAG: Hint domain-containing protein [Halocynthiibacter sp.]